MVCWLYSGLNFNKICFDLDEAIHRSQRQLRTFQSLTIPKQRHGSWLRVLVECLTVSQIVVEYLAYSVGEMWPPGARGMPALPLWRRDKYCATGARHSCPYRAVAAALHPSSDTFFTFSLCQLQDQPQTFNSSFRGTVLTT